MEDEPPLPEGAYRVVLTLRGSPSILLGQMPNRDSALLLAAWCASEYEREGLPSGELVSQKTRQANGDWALRLVGGRRVHIRVRGPLEEGDEV
jgi:hypothetical protein